MAPGDRGGGRAHVHQVRAGACWLQARGCLAAVALGTHRPTSPPDKHTYWLPGVSAESPVCSGLTSIMRRGRRWVGLGLRGWDCTWLPGNLVPLPGLWEDALSAWQGTCPWPWRSLWVLVAQLDLSLPGNGCGLG